MNYLDFDRSGLEFYWTIEAAEAYLPKLRPIFEKLSALKAKINHLQVKLRRAFNLSLKLQIDALEKSRIEFVNSLPVGVEVIDEMRDVAIFYGWSDENDVYVFVCRDINEPLKHYCTFSDVNADMLVNQDGNWISSGRTKGHLAHGQLEEIPSHWRSYLPN